MMKTMKVFFIFIFCVKSELLLENNELNLVDEDYLLDNQEDKFESGRLKVAIKNTENQFLDCIKQNGVKRSSFENCVGKDYEIVERKTRQLLGIQEFFMKDQFARSLKDFCGDEYKALCNDMIDKLNTNFLQNKINIDEFRQLADEYDVEDSKKEQFKDIVDELQRNFKDYKDTEDYQKVKRDSTIHAIQKLIDNMHIDVDYDYKTNPFHQQKVAGYHLAKERQPDMSKFHEEFLDKKNKLIATIYEKANGPIDSQHDIKKLKI